jgi:pimeloyl-ACP methyl ester carboxylesterase
VSDGLLDWIHFVLWAFPPGLYHHLPGEFWGSFITVFLICLQGTKNDNNIPSEENGRAIILVHGTNNSRTNGFVDQFVPFAARLHAVGFSVLMIDLRGHGESADSRNTYGLEARWDVLGGVDWLKASGYEAGKIDVLGYSLGAGSVIGATAKDEAIGAVWLDSAYVDIDSVLEHSWRSLSGLPQVFWCPTKRMVRLLYGVDLNASRPVDEIGKIAPRPIFMVHCKKDHLILISHMDRLLAAAQNTKTWVIENCDEGMAMIFASLQ